MSCFLFSSVTKDAVTAGSLSQTADQYPVAPTIARFSYFLLFFEESDKKKNFQPVARVNLRKNVCITGKKLCSTKNFKFPLIPFWKLSLLFQEKSQKGYFQQSVIHFIIWNWLVWFEALNGKKHSLLLT